MNGTRILAVDPGRTMLGVAVFDGAALCYYAVKMLRVPATPADVRHAATRMLTSLVTAYKPSHMVIEQPLIVQQRAELLAHVISALKTSARRLGLTISEFAPNEVRRFICNSKKPTKRVVAQRLIELYPELTRYVMTPRKWSEKYYERMFGAVAVGFMAYTHNESTDYA